MEPEGSLPHSQVTAICPYPEPAQSSPCLHPVSWISILILSSHLRLGLPSGLFPSVFPNKTQYAPLLSPIRETCPAHFTILYLVTRIIFDELYRSLSSSLCSLLRSPVPLFLLDPNIYLGILFSNTLGVFFSLNVSDIIKVFIIVLTPDFCMKPGKTVTTAYYSWRGLRL